jgi:calreticulin
MTPVLLLLAALVSAKVYYKETFDDSYTSRWVESSWKKASGEAGKWGHSAGAWYGDKEADKGLETTQDARFYAISSKFPQAFSNEGKDLVVQFSVKFPQKIDCGGGYIKVAGSDLDQAKFGGDSPYHIMFGPDICGYSTKKVHVIFHYPPKKDNLLIKKEITAETDQLTHVYTLIVRPDQTYEVRIDGEKKQSGSLVEDFDFLLPKTIKDPSQSKPSDWVDESTIDDPTDQKPDGWDNVAKQIPDPEADKPEDWDDEADGTWEAPLISNPEYKGEWKAKKIPNPAYKGVWVHPEIDNPDYVEDKNLYRFSDIGSVGIDVWQVKSGTIFDNILIGDSVAEAEAFLAETYTANKQKEKDAFDAAEQQKKDEEEAAKKAADASKPAEADEDEDDDDDNNDPHPDL